MTANRSGILQADHYIEGKNLSVLKNKEIVRPEFKSEIDLNSANLESQFNIITKCKWYEVEKF